MTLRIKILCELLTSFAPEMKKKMVYLDEFRKVVHMLNSKSTEAFSYHKHLLGSQLKGSLKSQIWVSQYSVMIREGLYMV